MQRSSWSVRRLAVGGIWLLVVAWLLSLSGVLIWGTREGARPSDAIVVLGAAQYDGTPSPALQGRLDRAFELYEDGLAPIIVLTGSKQEGDRFTEAYAGYRYLADRGVPDSALRVVDDGASTYESLAAASRVLGDEGAERVLLVSDSYHNRRIQGIARELGLEPFVAPTDGDPAAGQLVGETGRVAVGELIGYRRLFNQTR
jgi:uncharacterized SAM-binding protein YcdF (DUF218 family)